eukprot:m51a1_g2047 putative solute carrier family 35 member f6 (420) ;mRNA; r:1382448-1384140
MAGLTLKAGLMELGMLLTGCVNTCITKAQDDSEAVGWGGKDKHSFNHPWTQSLMMFWGEGMCLAVFFFMRYMPRPKGRGEAPYKNNPMTFWELFPPLLAIPAALDLLGSSIASIGLLYTTASVWQMFRGSIIIFTCILSMIFLKRKIPPYRWVAVIITICGLILVGFSSFFGSKDSATNSGSSEEEASDAGWKTLIGIVLILVGQLFGGVQMVVEEILLKKREYEPVHMVGMEGLFGTLLMSFIALPILFFIPGDNPSPYDHGSYDNAIDAFQQMGNNGALCAFCIISFFSIAFFNFFGLNVTKYLTAIHRTLIDACRSILIWMWQLFTFYVISRNYGEEWTKWSWFQVGGFILLMVGTFIYNGILKLPWFSYEEEKAEETKEDSCKEFQKEGTALDSMSTNCNLEVPQQDKSQLASSV